MPNRLLMGVIIAFETALVAQIFGAVIFVVNGIGIAVTRELGPLNDRHFYLPAVQAQPLRLS